MQIAKVQGTVVSTQKVRSLTGVKLLLVQFVDQEGALVSRYEVAADVVGAGVGEWVLVNRGSAARQEEGYGQRPLDALIVGIIDTVTLNNVRLYSKKEEYGRQAEYHLPPLAGQARS